MKLELGKKYLVRAINDSCLQVLELVKKTKDNEYYLFRDAEGREQWIHMSETGIPFAYIGEIEEESEEYMRPKHIIIPEGIDFFELGTHAGPMREGLGFVIMGKTSDGRDASIVINWDEPIEIKSSNPIVSVAGQELKNEVKKDAENI